MNPVVAADDESYERAAMITWLSQHGAVPPTSGLTLKNTDLVPNHALRSTIDRRNQCRVAHLLISRTPRVHEINCFMHIMYVRCLVPES